MVDGIKGAPKQSYVNSVYASQHDENVIYAAFNHHKYGDFKPYVFKSSDKGKSWDLISTNLPERGSVYSIEIAGTIIGTQHEIGRTLLHETERTLNVFVSTNSPLLVSTAT